MCNGFHDFYQFHNQEVQLKDFQHRMSDAMAREATHDLQTAVGEWKRVVGGIIRGGDLLDAPITHQCAETYGFGRCVDDFSAATQRVWSKMLHDLIMMSRQDQEMQFDYKKLILMSVARPPPGGAVPVGEIPLAGPPPARETVDGTASQAWCWCLWWWWAAPP